MLAMYTMLVLRDVRVYVRLILYGMLLGVAVFVILGTIPMGLTVC